MKNTFISSCDFHKSVALSATVLFPPLNSPPYCCKATLRYCEPGEAKNPKNDQINGQWLCLVPSACWEKKLREKQIKGYVLNSRDKLQVLCRVSLFILVHKNSRCKIFKMTCSFKLKTSAICCIYRSILQY